MSLKITIAIVFSLGLLSSIVMAEDNWRDKVDAIVLEQMAPSISYSFPNDIRSDPSSELGSSLNIPSADIEFFAFLNEQADLTASSMIVDRIDKGRWVMNQLVTVAERTQASLLAVLDQSNVDYRVYWVANMVWVRGSSAQVETLARRSDVSRILGNPRLAMPALPVELQASLRALAGVEANLTLVGAPAVWATGVTGQGAILASADTGVQWDHPALINQYSGWDGAVADHNYAWHDAIHSGGGSCGADSPVPCDDTSHGTHTVGIMVGDDGSGNQVGMAPGAKWIGCRNMDQGSGTPATYSECFQWFIAPTNLNDLFPDPSRAPHAINNSWTCPPSEGCGDPLILQTVVANTRAAGIAVVAAAGNSGPACSTVVSPPAIYDETFAVGATSITDVIASFSSLGPVTSDGSNRLKPDITAPGVGIRSTVPINGYGFKSGTSMAAPHVAGLMALLVSAQPELAGQPTQLEAWIKNYAIPLSSSKACGGDSASAVPNNEFGHGRIDAAASVQAAIGNNIPALSLPAMLIVALLLVLLYRARRQHPE